MAKRESREAQAKRNAREALESGVPVKDVLRHAEHHSNDVIEDSILAAVDEYQARRR